ncbi:MULTISPECIES: glycosyltransferase family 2 protein [unclassified Rhodococcus (in: high G+C Gram-positive bacteria)]|uniref:glycosyltransferase n=1 Tax=unclassified Rhodococcus (in: high G+C Gram-positive bacteria) TaxID=192944 RepID=UPI0021C1ED7F|nr:MULTISPECIES: glycosyltransferase [unclassified Rhodococcus (in: high G+C Gram-positive bacteria)]
MTEGDSVGVSVIVPTRNAVSTIDDQLDALSRQTYDRPFEVLVCDNGSVDGTVEHVSSRPPTDAYVLRCIDASAVSGASYARNAGAAVARGDFLAFCDADDRVSPGWLAALTAAARHADVVSGALETETLNSPLVRTWRSAPPRETRQEWPKFLALMTGASFGVTATAYRAVGGCDESYVGAAEDTDLAFRLQLAGYTLVHAPDAVIAYRLRGTMRGLWRQSVTCGQGDARLFHDYRAYGMPRRHPITTVDVIALVVLRNPLLPTWITRLERGRWVFWAGNLVGRIRGSRSHRVFYV